MADKVSKTFEIRAEVKDATSNLDELSTSVNKFTEDLDKAGSTWGAVGSQMMVAGGIMTAAISVPLAMLAKEMLTTASDFEQSMAGVAAVSGATGDSFIALSEQARELGATTRYSATEAAGGMSMLARAGWDVEEIMEGMPGLLSLAAAGAVDLAIAADIVSDVMAAFGENADQAGRYADVFASAAANANTTVEALGQAMAYAAPAAAAAGFTIEETAAALSALADAGIKSTRAGTTMDAVLRELRDKAQDGTLAFETFGVSIYDAEGNMRSFFDILGSIEAGLEGMTQQQRDAELATVFTTRSLRGMNIFLTRGTDSLKVLEGTLSDSTGAAEKMADVMMDTLQGSLIELNSALEGVKIAFGEALIGPATTIVRSVTDIARSIASVDEDMRNAILTVGAVLIALGPLLVAFGLLVTLVASASTAWPVFVGVIGGFATAVLPVIAAIGGIAGAIYVVNEAVQAWRDSQVTLEDTLAASYERLLGGYRHSSAEILQEQAERNVIQIREEIATLEAMGDAVDQSELSDAYKRLTNAILEEQRASNVLRLEEQRRFLSAMNEDAETGYKDYENLMEEQYANLQSKVQEAVQNQITEFQKMHIAGDITLDEYNRMANGAEEWGKDLLHITAHNMNEFAAGTQSGLAQQGMIWDSQLQKLVPITDRNMQEIKDVVRRNLDDMPPDMENAITEAYKKMFIASRTGNTQMEREAFGELLDILNKFGIDAVSGAEIISYDIADALAEGIGEGVNDSIEEFKNLEKGTEEQLNAAVDIAEYVMENALTPTMRAKAEMAVNAFAEGGEDAAPTVLRMVESLIADIEAGMDKIDTRPVGKSVVEGIREGAYDPATRHRLVSGIEEIGEEIPDILNNILEIRSPSGVTKRIGIGVVEGLIAGIESVSRSVINTVENIADNIFSTFDTLKNNSITAFYDMGDGIDTAMADAQSLIDSNINRITGMVSQFASDMHTIATRLGNNIVNGIMNEIRHLPRLVLDIMRSIVRSLLSVGSSFYNTARNVASRMWQGFQAGLGISSPSYIEEAIEDIIRKSKELAPALASEFDKLKDLERTMPELELDVEMKAKNLQALERAINYVPRGIEDIDPSVQEDSRNEKLAHELGLVISNSILSALSKLTESEKGDIVLNVDGKTLARILKPHFALESVRTCDSR